MQNIDDDNVNVNLTPTMDGLMASPNAWVPTTDIAHARGVNSKGTAHNIPLLAGERHAKKANSPKPRKI